MHCHRSRETFYALTFWNDKHWGMQAREDLEHERRRAATVDMALAAKEVQLEHWQRKAEHAAERLAAALNAPLAPADPELLSPVAVGATSTSSTCSLGGGGDIGGGKMGQIVAKWKTAALQQCKAAKHAEAKLADMRAQALMLERQVETAEDALDAERCTAATRSAELRAQVNAAEASAAQHSKDMAAALAAATASDTAAHDAAEAEAAARSRIRALEDLLRATETELRAAMGQIEAVQSNAEALDERLRSAESAKADLAAADAATDAMLKALRHAAAAAGGRAAAAAASAQLPSSTAAAARLQMAVAIVATLESEAEARRAAAGRLAEQCESLETDAAATRATIARLREELARERDQNVRLKQLVSEVRIDQRLSGELDSTGWSRLQKKCRVGSAM
jgi:trimeric autotransporter adhesin